jgi:hypothetical protein
MKIQSVKLKDGRLLEFGDFNAIIGGNAVGKTTLLLELFYRADERERPRWYWLGSELPNYVSDKPVEDLRLLQRSMSLHYDGASRYYFSQSVRNLDGSTDLDTRYRFAPSDFEVVNTAIEKADHETAKTLLRGLKYHRPFVVFASCEARLNLPNTAQVTPLNQSAQEPLNVLFRNRGLKSQIDQKVVGQFGLHLALLDHARSQLQLGLSSEAPPSFNDKVDDLQGEFSRIEDWKAEHFASIQDVGHGIRSMVKLLMSLLDPVNQIVIIDEPELFIYPAQKRWLGKQLVSLAREQSKQVFLVTHDPIILQGILDVSSTTRVLRIDMGADRQRTLRECDLKHLDDVGAKRNQDSYLQGLFYQRSVAVEGAADRGFYQIMVEELMGSRIENRDVGFVACGGKGASKNVAYITSRVGLRTAFLYDFDALLFDIPVLRDIVTMLGGSQSDALDKLENLLCERFGNDKRRIKEETGHAEKIGMESPYAKEHKVLFESAFSELSKVGIFIIPGGSLESWAPDAEPKVRFAEVAPDLIKGNENLRRPLEQFLDPVLRFIEC